jgi:hypothetical protein
MEIERGDIECSFFLGGGGLYRPMIRDDTDHAVTVCSDTTKIAIAIAIYAPIKKKKKKKKKKGTLDGDVNT